MFETMQSLDFSLLDLIAARRFGAATNALTAVTRLGDNGVLWIAIALMLCVFKKTRRTGVLMIIALAATFVVSTLGLKHLFSRARPCVVEPDKTFLFCPAGYSFPSGHSISSFAAAGVLWFRRQTGAFAAMLAAFLIAFSRVYMFVHFPTDVLTGALLGLAAAYIVCNLAQKRANS